MDSSEKSSLGPQGQQRPAITIETNQEAKEKVAPPGSETSSPSSGDTPAPDLSTSNSEIPRFQLPGNLQWLVTNFTWPKLKPVIRCAVVAWLSAILFIIPTVQRFMGQASFLILISNFLAPPSDPFICVLEREILIVLFISMAWAWACLGMKLADLSRTVHNPSATIFDAISGRYVEAAPSVIIAVFIFLGSAFFLYIKARQGPGPYLFATILGCICIDISLTTAALLPFPFYSIGRAVVIPLVFNSALAILGSIFIFPTSMSTQYTSRLQDFLSPLISAVDFHRKLLKMPISSPDFPSTVASVAVLINKSEASLIPLAATARLLGSDLVYSRFAPGDFRTFQQMSRKIAGRANGLGLYFTLVAPGAQERFPMTPAPSPPHSPISSRRVSPERGRSATSNAMNDSSSFDRIDRVSSYIAPSSRRSRSRSTSRTRVHKHRHTHPHSHRHPHNSLQNSLLHLTMSRSGRHEHAVGVFESQRYMDLEAVYIRDPKEDKCAARNIELLGESCDDLLVCTQQGLSASRDWMGSIRKGKWTFWKSHEQRTHKWGEELDVVQQTRHRLFASRENFRNTLRHRVIDPYRAAFEQSPNLEGEIHIPHHLHLFHSYVYQYHLLQFSNVVISMLDEVIRLEGDRKKMRLWTPMQKIFWWSPQEVAEDIDKDDDQDPDVIQGLTPAIIEDLGLPLRRDPDALPPRNAFEWIMSVLYHVAGSFSRGNALFALKAGLFTVLLSLPSLIRSSAPFAYENKFVWAVFMGQLTLARFRGDTAFGLTARIVSTFLGGVVGMGMWYISCGSGRGNPYGLAAVFAVCFPFFFYARLYWPGPPMTNIVFFVTALLVVGYSYQDVHIALPGSPGFGFSVAWRRFVLVTVGVVAAFIVSFLPPSTTIRRYQRNLLSTTSSEIGAIYTSIISFANSRRDLEIQEILTSLIAVRSKLKRSAMLRENTVYEFSLRGRWPSHRYQLIMELQMQLSHSLSHLMCVLEHLDTIWTKAFLSRARFLDPRFQGDVLAVISLISSSLRTGEPLPQVTPCPLLDRFLESSPGFRISQNEVEEDSHLPKSLTIDTLQNEQYLIFCVGVSTAFRIINRLDRLMVATKEIVGEQYHIHGLSSSFATRIGTAVEHGRPNAVSFRPPNSV